MIILVIASAYTFNPNEPILPLTFNIYSIGVLFTFVTIQGKALKKEHDKYNNQYKDINTWIWLFLNKYINILRLASVVSYFFCFIIVAIKILFPNSIKAYKSDYAFGLYIIMIIYSLLFEFYYYIRKKNGGLKLLKIIGKVFGIGQTTRITTSIVICMIVLLPNLRDLNLIDSSMFLLAFNLLLTSMGGFALNDYFDSDKDKINKPHRPIPSNRITRKTSLRIAYLLLFISFVFSIYNTLITSFGFMQLLLLGAMILYNYVTKVLAVTKTIYTALISSLVVSYPLMINFFDYRYFLLPIATFFFILGREIFMDILDIEGDRKSGISTLPIKFGIKISLIIAFTSVSLGTLLVSPLFLPAVAVVNFIRLSVIILSIISFSLLWMYGSNIKKKIAIIYLWIPMLTGLTILFM